MNNTRKIIVKNIGPIKEADLELKKFNILIGQQSTGKSTLAKIACYCSWVEKEISITQSPEEFQKEGYFINHLEEFHKLNGFISKDSFIAYSSDVLSFAYSERKFTFQWNSGRLDYKRHKTLYIPAERNIVSVIPNWFEVNLGKNSTRSFLADWERVRKHFSKEHPLSLLDFGEYYHNPSDNTDHILTKEGKDVLLGNASSGLQTLTPLQALLQYYANDFYSSGLSFAETNVTEQQKINRLYDNILQQLIKTLSSEERASWEEKRVKIHSEYKDFSSVPEHLRDTLLYPNDEIMNKYFELAISYRIIQSTSFFIEEPELNLYPISQYALMNSMVQMINKKQHTLFITTHSIYSLTSLSNLIYAGKVGKEHPNKTNNIIPKSLWIDMDDISAWKINAETGELENMLADDLAMLKAEKLDDVSEIINSQFDKLFELEHQNL